MANFREKFKATKIKDLKKAVDKDDAMVGVSNNDYLNLEDGKTLKIRISQRTLVMNSSMYQRSAIGYHSLQKMVEITSVVLFLIVLFMAVLRWTWFRSTLSMLRKVWR